MSDPYSRRRFIQTGTALLSAPAFLIGCGSRPAQQATVAPAVAATPDNPFLEWFSIDEARLRRVLAELGSRGADHAELYFQHSRSNSISMEDGLISSAHANVDLGVGLRVIIGDQVGYAYTEDLGEEAMLEAARSAAAIARGSAVSTPASFTAASPGRFYELRVPWSDVEVDAKLPIIRRAAELAEAGDPAVDKVRVSWNDTDERVLIVDLQGQMIVDRRPMTRLYVVTNATKKGVVQTGSSNLAARQGVGWYTEERLQTVAREAVDRTMVLFDARQPPAGELPVVLAAGASGILLHEAIGHGMEADFNRKNTSIYADMIGKEVAPDFVTIVDDGTIPHERGALNYDDEGTPTERTVLVDRGVLASYLHDRISARHYGRKQSTGSGRRESFRHVPLPRMRCTTMLDGPHSREEIIASVDKGIIAETFTNGQVQIGAGDFTFYIKNGWLVEGGKITAPIRDCNIIGNGPEALRKVTMAANDSKLDTGGWTCGKDGQGVPVSQGLPTVLVSSMTVGGTSDA
ncbi:MAG: TldD/PmbA family protein [Myxococcales bacterium]|nr:TldD/PmbA family protein [Myxococcales bacterium]MCB9715100.1 TldD/PmbA family protein [Myxococcales bacterium]